MSKDIQFDDSYFEAASDESIKEDLKQLIAAGKKLFDVIEVETDEDQKIVLSITFSNKSDTDANQSIQTK